VRRALQDGSPWIAAEIRGTVARRDAERRRTDPDRGHDRAREPRDGHPTLHAVGEPTPSTGAGP
jgi:hypothetical protein